MKIALLGYGRMGKTIAAYAEKRKHEIVFILDRDSEEGDLSSADVAINFSVPEAAVSNIKFALKEKIAVVSGTTGWLENYDQVTSFCKTHKGAFLYGSNFSIGVNLLFKINKYIAKIINPYLDNYTTEIEEIHHKHKLDSPSGTAITIAQGIIEETDYTKWNLDKVIKGDLTIKSYRRDEEPGTHILRYKSEIDEISVKHEAFKRDGFAIGALIAAEWLHGKKGVFNIEDVLNIY